MKGDGGLSLEERTFFSLLTETVYANPFGSDPDRLERLLGAEASDGLTSQADYYIRLIPALEGRIRALQGRGLTRIERFRAEDSELMRQVLLFYCYQRHFSAFDTLIEAQVEDRTQSPGLPAGGEILA